jgi:hypothetical protein
VRAWVQEVSFMKLSIRQTEVQLWHFTCPQCGIGDGETEYHAATHMIYCEICIEEGQQVKLERWPADTDSRAAPRRRLGGV